MHRLLLNPAKTSWDRYQRGVQGIFDTLESQRRAFDAEPITQLT